jgi:5-methylcytosine-specific restriction endonuclease McrBC regulatory subunit McrC
VKFAGAQKLYACKEHEPLAIPIRDLLTQAGDLDIYPEIASRGYFEIAFRQGALLLRASRFVGLIPLSDRIAVHVTPKAPIANLIYMIWRSGKELDGLSGFIRGYQEEPGVITSPEELYIKSFIAALRVLRQSGPLRRYDRRETDTELRGRLMVMPSVSRFVARGYRDRHVFEVFDHSSDITENRILKHTTERLLRHLIAQPAGDNLATARELKNVLALLGNVNANAIDSLTVSRRVPALMRSLPSTHRFYEPALWLSYLISTRSGVSMEMVGRARFETVIIDVSLVFENYVRKICLERAASHLGDCEILDGNRWPVPLFVTSAKHTVHPDLYFRRKGRIVAVADTKYKPEPSTQDRYEMLAFCEALGVTNAAFICPKTGSEPTTTHYGTTLTGRRLDVLRIDLAQRDMGSEEDMFVSSLSKILAIT